MWYGDIILKLDTETTYSRQQIYELLLLEKPNISRNSFNWIINNMVKNGNLTKVQRGMYSVPADGMEKQSYQPVFREKTAEIIGRLEERFPLIEFTCFESVQLNEFLNHLIAQNTCFIMTERDVLDSVFRYLQEGDYGNVLLKPSVREWDSYWTGGSIILLNRISEAPRNAEVPHGISIEQMLVDIVAEKTMQLLYSRNEIARIYDKASESYKIDMARLMRYARRRGKAEEIKKYAGGIL